LCKLYGINQLWAGDVVFNNYRIIFVLTLQKKQGWIPVNGEIILREMPYNAAQNSKPVKWEAISTEKEPPVQQMIHEKI